MQTGSRDNISVIVVDLQAYLKHLIPLDSDSEEGECEPSAVAPGLKGLNVPISDQTGMTDQMISALLQP